MAPELAQHLAVANLARKFLHDLLTSCDPDSAMASAGIRGPIGCLRQGLAGNST
jgi:hypothetical protein